MHAHPFIEDIDDDADRDERTMITAPGFSIQDLAGESSSDDDVPTADRLMDETKDFDVGGSDIATAAVDIGSHRDVDDFAPSDEQPTVARQPHEITARKPVRPGPPPAALAASNPTPSISELRKPRPSRRTPAEGVTSGPGSAEPPSVLQSIVKSNNNAPMPSTRQSAVVASAPRPAPVTNAPVALPLTPNAAVSPYGQTAPPPMSVSPYGQTAPPPIHGGAFGSGPYQSGQPPVAQNPYPSGQQPVAYQSGQPPVAQNPYPSGQPPVAYQSGQQPVVGNPYPYQQGQPPGQGQPMANMGGTGYLIS